MSLSSAPAISTMVPKTALLTRAEERAIAERVYDRVPGWEKDRDVLVERNIRLAIHLAGKYLSHYDTRINDLISEGCMGLMDAANRYNPRDFSASFATYATWWIKQRIARWLSNNASIIRCPVHVNDRERKVQKLKRSMEAELGREVDDTEAMEVLGFTDAQIASVLKARLSVASLDAPVGDGEIDFGDLVADAGAGSADDYLLQNDSFDLMMELMKGMPEVERDILMNRHGLNAEETPMTLEQLGVKYGVTRERIRQIQAKATKSLRRRYAARSGRMDEAREAALDCEIDQPVQHFTDAKHHPIAARSSQSVWAQKRAINARNKVLEKKRSQRTLTKVATAEKDAKRSKRRRQPSK